MSPTAASFHESNEVGRHSDSFVCLSEHECTWFKLEAALLLMFPRFPGREKGRFDPNSWDMLWQRFHYAEFAAESKID